MANEPKELDFDNMSDEDFLKLDESQFSGNVPEGETTLTNEEYDESIQISNDEPDPEVPDSTDTPDDDSSTDESDGNDDSGTAEQGQEGETPDGGDPMAGEGQPASEEGETPDGEQSSADTEEEGKAGDETPDGSGDGGAKPDDQGQEKLKDGKAETPAKAGYYKLPEGMDTAAVDSAIGFFQKITAPFKADGRDFTVRSAEDAIRLIQQGVNYSRRMQEMKPMKNLNRMLESQGLNDPEKLNFLIDLSKGDKGAITTLLKNHKIDPMDLDIEKDTGYQARNYQGDPQDNDFRDALDAALTSTEGQALVSHIHKDWDAASKARLRENPGILGNLQELKASGVYDKVVDELRYQQNLGYLQGVPFLQAFDQVGEAMKNAGVLSAPTVPAQVPGSMAPLAAQGAPTGQPPNQPLASGGRKQQAPKNPAANPLLSSTPSSKQSAKPPAQTVDYDKMSDEEFLKMPPPE